MIAGRGKVAVLARTRWGLDAARQLLRAGETIGIVATAPAEAFYGCDASDYEALAREAGAPFVDSSKQGETDLAQSMAAAGCRIGISVNWPRVLGREVIASLPLGIVNAHAGDLPRYRGNACPNWAILNGESHIGLCAHLMEADSLDSGPVVLRDRLPLGADADIGDVYRWLDERIPTLLAETARGLLDGKLAPVAQRADPALALRCYPRRPEDGKIDWRDSATRVHRLVRASSRPFAGAFGSMPDGRRVTVWRAQLYDHPGRFFAVPGQVMLRAEGVPVIACGDGCIVLKDVEIEGLAPAAALAEVGRSLRARLS